MSTPALTDQSFPFPIVPISEDERRSGEFSAEHFRAAALALHTHGYVILKAAVAEDIIQDAAAEFESIFADCRRSREGDAWYQSSAEHQAIFWERNSRWRIFPKLRGVMSHPTLVANPFAIRLFQFYLGENYYCKFVSSDTCLKGATLQAPHRELGAGEFWEPEAFVVNVPLCRCTLENGPLEIWPGSGHLWRNEVLRQLEFLTEAQDEENPECLAFADSLPSCKVTLELGDVLIRNPALLHRGTVNTTDSPRSMLTICYFRQGKDHDYGRWEYNLDEPSYQQLSRDVQRLFPAAKAAFEPPAESGNSRENRSSSGSKLWKSFVARFLT